MFTITRALAAVAAAGLLTAACGSTPISSRPCPDEVLSRPVTVPGDATKTALPAPGATTSVGGFTLTVGGKVMAGMSHELTVDVSKAGRPVTDLQPYLDTDAHLTAFHATNLAFAHLHPQGKTGSKLTFEAMLPQPGDWRLFIQFQTDNVRHTAAVTISAA